MFDKVLVLNRGEIACRILGTCRRLGIRSVAVYSDADANAPHVALADEAVRLGKAPVKESYINIDAVLAALAATGADALHPGYGLLSESPALARAVTRAGVCFVGPSPEALTRLGDKVAARELAQGVGLEPPPGTEGAVTAEEARASAERIGYPLLVKAAAGGGGIGMQLVSSRAELEQALGVARARAGAAFGDERVYLERYLAPARHIELQLLRDATGRSLVLGERECSVQRRHQKLVEESPSPAAFLRDPAGAARLARVGEQARELLAACDYVGVATVEFVADGRGQLYFLEVNARLQVEHAVTEQRAGVDLVQAQLAIAAGEPLDPALLSLTLSGHAIEARLYAEDPAHDFMPQPGRVVALCLPQGVGLRVDAGVIEGYEVTPHYDPLLLKLIAHAETRDQAIERLDRALGELVLKLEGKRGSRTTNQALLRQVLASPDFQRGDYDTGLVGGLLTGA